MERVRFAGEEEDDLYGGFDFPDTALNTEELAYDPAFQQAVRTSHGRRPPPTAARLGTMAAGRKSGVVIPPSSMGMRPITGAQDGGKNRPMTAVKAAGYTSGSRGGAFDPMNQSASSGTAPPLEPKPEDTPEEKIKQLERAVNLLIEESCLAGAKGEDKLALDKAREAARKERDINHIRSQDSKGLANQENVNLDLSYSVSFNLANQLAANHMDTEALNTYKEISRTKVFNNAGRLKVNMGNIYFRQHEFSQAIKHYRMALDQIPATHKNMRTKINQNIGIAFVKLGQYNDAATTFRTIMSEEPNFRTGFNLILCNYALGDRDEMKRSFERLLSVDLKLDNEDKYVASKDDKQYSLILEVIKNDSLRKIEKQRRNEAEQCIMMATKIIAPAIDSTFEIGYNWCIKQVQSSQYMELAHNLDIDKAIGFLKQKDFQQAVDTLKSFEKKDSKVASAAATNLSFLYGLEGELNQADKYAEVALQADRFNPSALVNKGNVFFNKGEFEKSRECYREALESDSSCVEALYNYGICNKRLNCYEDALRNFEKLHTILKNSSQVMFQLADLHYLLGNGAEAKEWYIQLHGLVPSDAMILKRLGDLYEEEGDYQSAFHYYYDSFKYDSTNIEVIKWLGNYYIQIQEIEKALPYFQKAAMIQPTQVQWPLFVAMCLRKTGDVQRALDEYKSIHRRFPDNVECLKHLLKMLTDMNSKDVPEYANKLKKAERSQKLREERASSGRQTSGRRRLDREGSANEGGRQQSGQVRRAANYDNTNGSYRKPESDGVYSDPLGPQMERPRTAARRRDQADDFENEEIGDDLLPD